MLELKISQPLTSLPGPVLPAWLSDRPRISLANTPTPIESLVRFSEATGGPTIFIKRDDLTGLATGGNKTRKLEFLIGDAISKGADTVITAGGPQSNHCRQTAAAAARAGLDCHLVFGGSSDSPLNGNRFLDQVLGAHEHWTPKGTRESKMAELETSLTAQGRRPYVIPVGGSNSIGALGYVAAMYELKAQMETHSLEFDRIVYATSSGGTQAGMTVGAKASGFAGALTAISIDQVPDGTSSFDYKAFVLDIAKAAVQESGLNFPLSLEDFAINYDFLGAGYGVVGDPERKAIRLMAQTEGILVDPVYSGRALAGLIALVEEGKIKNTERVLFWHTGGEIALHAYIDDLTER